MFVLLIKRLLQEVGRWARKPINHTSWVAVVTPTNRPKSVRNRCVIEVFCGVVLPLCAIVISVVVGAFVIGLSQISSFLSQYFHLPLMHLSNIRFNFVVIWGLHLILKTARLVIPIRFQNIGTN